MKQKKQDQKDTATPKQSKEESLNENQNYKSQENVDKILESAKLNY